MLDDDVDNLVSGSRLADVELFHASDIASDDAHPIIAHFVASDVHFRQVVEVSSDEFAAELCDSVVA